MNQKRNRSLHGSVPDNSSVALVLIDVINDFEFPEAAELLRFADAMADAIARLRAKCDELHIPVIYVNDNFGLWRSDFASVLAHCLEPDCRGREIAEKLKPKSSDYFCLKPKHSGFYSTTLGVLLEYIGCTTVVLAGMAANICVLFTANDAYMRDFQLIVPADCVASNTIEETNHALAQMQSILKADISTSNQITATKILEKLTAQSPLDSSVG